MPPSAWMSALVRPAAFEPSVASWSDERVPICTELIRAMVSDERSATRVPSASTAVVGTTVRRVLSAVISALDRPAALVPSTASCALVKASTCAEGRAAIVLESR